MAPADVQAAKRQKLGKARVLSAKTSSRDGRGCCGTKTCPSSATRAPPARDATKTKDTKEISTTCACQHVSTPADLNLNMLLCTGTSNFQYSEFTWSVLFRSTLAVEFYAICDATPNADHMVILSHQHLHVLRRRHLLCFKRQEGLCMLFFEMRGAGMMTAPINRQSKFVHARQDRRLYLEISALFVPFCGTSVSVQGGSVECMGERRVQEIMKSNPNAEERTQLPFECRHFHVKSATQRLFFSTHRTMCLRRMEADRLPP